MNKNKIGLYITENYIYFCNSTNIYKADIEKEVIINNRINKSSKFLKTINIIKKKCKLNDSILGNTLCVVNLPNYLESDRELLSSILEKAGFNNIKFINYEDLVIKDNVLINILANTIIISKNNKVFSLYTYNLSQTLVEDLILVSLTDFINNENVIFIGEVLSASSLRNKIEKKFKVKCYQYDNSELYISSILQKKND